MSILLLILERGTNVNVNAFAPLPSRNVHVFEGRQSFSQIGVVGTKSSSPTASSTTSVTKSSPSTLTQPVSPIDTSISTSTNTNTNSNESTEISTSSSEYKRGLAIIGFITLMFSSNSPVLHAAFVNSENPPSVLLLNAATSSLALMGLVTFGPILNSVVPLPSSLKQNQKEEEQQKQKQQQRMEQKIELGEKESSLLIPFLNDKMKGYLGAGVELGFWKTLGTTANLYGLSLTTANHGAFLIQLTTLIVPSIQGLMGVPVPKRIWTSIGLALSGIILFTQDMAGGGGGNMDALLTTNTMLLGDALCVVAAVFYATYDLRLFDYGKKVPPLPLIRTKIAVQALLSCILLAVLGENDGFNEVTTYVQQLMASTSSSNDLLLVGSAIAWSGLIINALVPFLQVSGQQTIGASRAQVVYASQPLWASMLSFVFLGEALGENGLIGGFLFLVAIFLAASAESPDADCGNDNCEV
jgi:drug/metabolite transporter (DMT)-like permease